MSVHRFSSGKTASQYRVLKGNALNSCFVQLIKWDNLYMTGNWNSDKAETLHFIKTHTLMHAQKDEMNTKLKIK